MYHQRHTVVGSDGLVYRMNYTLADFNGDTAPYHDSITGQFHLYFAVINNPTQSLYYTTSTDGVSWQYVKSFNAFYGAPQSFTSYAFRGQAYYLNLYTYNQGEVWYTLGSGSPANAPPQAPYTALISSVGALDAYIVTAGVVDNGTHVLGVLYGASDSSELNNNAIFVQCLQRSVVWLNTNMVPGVTANGYDNAIVPLTGLTTTQLSVMTQT